MESVERSWAELSAAEKRERRWAAFVDAPIPFVSPEAEAAYRARATRLKQADPARGSAGPGAGLCPDPLLPRPRASA